MSDHVDAATGQKKPRKRRRQEDEQPVGSLDAHLDEPVEQASAPKRVSGVNIRHPARLLFI